MTDALVQLANYAETVVTPEQHTLLEALKAEQSNA
jgi:hypothetical protein